MSQPTASRVEAKGSEPGPHDAPAQAADTRAADIDTAPARLAIAAVSLGGLAVAGFALLFDAGPLATVGLLVFSLLGLGSAPWQLNTELRLAGRLSVTILTSLAILTAGSMGMLALRQWAPGPTFAAVAAVSVLLHLLGARRAWYDIGPTTPTGLGRGRRPGRSPATALAGVGAALCLIAALTHRHLEPDFGGFLPQIGPVWFLGLAAVLAALAWAKDDAEEHIAVPVVALMLVLTLTPALVYGMPRSQSAAKHVDLIQQIRTLHQLGSTLDIYRDWRGFFAAAAWLCDIAGIRDPMVLATYWPPLLGVFRLAALRYLFGQILPDSYRCWVAVTLALLADSIGADYFSPQSVGFVIGIVVFGIALDGAAPRSGVAFRLPLLLVAGMLLAVSHQLSPYIVGGALVLLVVCRQVRPWWTLLMVLGPAAIWAFAHRAALSGRISLGQLLQPDNFRPPQTTASTGLSRLPIVTATVDALVLGILIVGVFALVGLALHHRQFRLWAVACCPAVGLACIAVTPYGQEGIFRAALFGLPWLALLGGYAVGHHRRAGLHLPLLATIAVLTTTFLTASFGLDGFTVIRASDVAAFQYFHAQGGAHPLVTYYLLSLGPGDLPVHAPTTTGGHETLINTADHQALARESLGDPQEASPLLAPGQEMAMLTTKLLAYSGEPVADAKLYAIWSPVCSNYAWAYGVRRPERFAALRDAFRTSSYWRVAFTRQDTVVFAFEPVAYQAHGA